MPVLNPLPGLPRPPVLPARSAGGIPAATLVRYGTLAAAVMIGLAVLLRGGDVSGWFPPDAWRRDTLLGLGVGAAFALAAWTLVGILPPFRRMMDLLLRTLDLPTFRPHHALLLGLLAGVPEEVLFRGAIQPALGLPLTALLFGALHALTPAYFVYATLAGAFLGGLEAWRGGLWAPIAAHTAIDAIVFLLLIRSARPQG